MKKCNTCGTICQDTYEFCYNCGSKLVIQTAATPPVRYCMRCGKELLPNAGFCMQCGMPVRQTEMPSSNMPEHQRRRVYFSNNDIADYSSFENAPNRQSSAGNAPYPQNRQSNSGSTPYIPAQRQSGNAPYTPAQQGQNGNAPYIPAQQRQSGNAPYTPAQQGQSGNAPYTPARQGQNGNMPYIPTQQGQNGNLPNNSPRQSPAGNTSNANVQQAAASSNSSFYLIEFIQSLFKAHNIPVFIYMVMNVLFIVGFVVLLAGGDIRYGIPIGILIYLLSISIALSPIGEAILRFQTKCKPIDDQTVLSRMMPIFDEAKRRAVIAAASEGRSIPDDIKIFYCDEESPNAFATGRKTICFTKGILNCSDEMILATLEHEFGHIAHHDTDSILMITVGNMLVTAIITFFRIGVILFDMFFGIFSIFMGGSEGIVGLLLSAVSRFLSLLFIDLFMWLWTTVGNLLVLKSMRSREFKADEFAFKCGKGRELQTMLLYLSGGNIAKTQGLFATLVSSHPETADRITALQALEAQSMPVITQK